MNSGGNSSNAFSKSFLHHHLNPDYPLPYHHQTVHPPDIQPYATHTSWSYPTRSIDLGFPPHQSSQDRALCTTPSFYQTTTVTQTHQYGVAPQNLCDCAAINPSHNSFTYPTDGNNLQTIPMHCKVCNVVSDSKNSLDEHMHGKKHKNSILQQQASEKVYFPPHLSMPKGTVGSAWCEICMIDCTSRDDLKSHRMGKKHKKKLKKLHTDNSVDTKASTSSQTNKVCNVVSNNENSLDEHMHGKKHKNVVLQQQASEKVYFTPHLSMPKGTVGAAWCEICMIDCTSRDDLMSHITGKKHKKRLKKLHTDNSVDTKASTSSQTNRISRIASVNKNRNAVKHAKMKAMSGENVNTKRQKVLSEGAAVDAVRVCSICNVVCNSKLVFISHLAGHKHLSMIKKQVAANGSAITRTPAYRVA